MAIISLREIARQAGIDPENPSGRMQRLFQDTCYKAMDKFVPKDQGDLRTKVDLSNPMKIVYESPYAHAQYVGYTTGPVRKYTTSGTGPYWDYRMWTAKKDEIIRTMQRGGRVWKTTKIQE